MLTNNGNHWRLVRFRRIWIRFGENDGSASEELITISDFVTEINKSFNNNRNDFMEAKRMIQFPPHSLEMNTGI
jgi:hypothetical protein